jgi:hypothetical protein
MPFAGVLHRLYDPADLPPITHATRCEFNKKGLRISNTETNGVGSNPRGPFCNVIGGKGQNWISRHGTRVQLKPSS